MQMNVPVEELSDAILTQNPTPKERFEVRVRRIKLNLRSLKELAATPYVSNVHDTLSVPLFTFNGVWFSQLPRERKHTPRLCHRSISRLWGFESSNMHFFMHFVVRSCLPKISHRLGYMSVSKHPLDDILDGWMPTPEEIP
jgi:hypothetical protein